MLTNNIEIRVFGLQRSGNHAIVSWIVEQYKGKKICFLNNVRHGDSNPFLTASQKYTYDMGEVPIKELANTVRDVLIYSYEDDVKKLRNTDSFLSSVYCQEFELNRQTYLGESIQKIEAIVIRDPYNFFASRLKKLDSLTGIKDIETIVSFWKELAREAIAIEKNPEDSRVVINYNRWFSDKDYRQHLSKRFSGVFSDASLQRVSGLGGGSSFDEKTFDKSLSVRDIVRKWDKFFQPSTYRKVGSYLKKLRGAKQMKVLERWQEMKQDPRLAKLLEDRELLHLSREIFGEISGF
jgi:hypothetical protein